MSSIVFQKQDLESLLNHHINILKRFTNENESQHFL
ncbi:Uncharacterised protein [Campylobacter sputorum subsp. sputorum]|uniref:Uncharacterized protein n=1 Tax=Campylobacter sputorum subsp. sputorum TaxID=32024 RepID=A0A381DGT6_9BACT|nr:Uncharacterised protein [Campylobacter sputorum subsp. sputorum]